MTGLKELKLSDNRLSGELPSSIGQMAGLEVLELQSNKLTSLPDDLKALVHLRVLNVAQNALTSLPLTSLNSITEILASKNNLRGALFGPAVLGMIRLQTLDVSVNQLSELSSDVALPDLPELRTLNIAFNRMTTLPDLSTTPKLTELLAEDNSISTLPDGFTDLKHLRIVDLTGNNMNKLDERIALMDCLESFKLQANPLRDRKFLTMGTAELKRDLKARLGPASVESSEVLCPGFQHT